MTIEEAIRSRVHDMPDALQQEVLDFIEHLTPGDADSTLSLTCAMRGMEDEDSPYSTADLKDTFS